MLRLVLLLCLGTVVIQASNPDLAFLSPRTTGQCSCDDLEKRINNIQASIDQWHCPDGWQSFRRSCYMVSGKAASWEEARLDCSVHEADLVTISSAEENAFVKDLATKHSPTTKQVWIGFFVPNGSTSFAWVNSSKSRYASWQKGEPNHLKIEHCVYMYTAPGRPGRQQGKWNNSNCKSSKSWPAGHVCVLRTSRQY